MEERGLCWVARCYYCFSAKSVPVVATDDPVSVRPWNEEEML